MQFFQIKIKNKKEYNSLILEGGKEAFKQRERKYDMGSKKKF